MLATPSCRRCFDALKLAAPEIGGVQIQNAGTVAGNLCNASPAADGVPPCWRSTPRSSCLATRRRARCRSRLPARQPANRAPPTSFLAALRVPARSARRPLGLPEARRPRLPGDLDRDGCGRRRPRRPAASPRRRRGRRCSAVASRLPALEARLRRPRRPRPARPTSSTPAELAALAPIDDVRANAAYRRDAADPAAPRPARARPMTARDRRDARSFASRVNGRAPGSPSTRRGACPTCCATSSASPAPRSAATPAIAAPAPCCSTARRSAPA